MRLLRIRRDGGLDPRDSRLGRSAFANPESPADRWMPTFAMSSAATIRIRLRLDPRE
jgi:hypothetical protein